VQPTFSGCLLDCRARVGQPSWISQTSITAVSAASRRRSRSPSRSK